MEQQFTKKTYSTSQVSMLTKSMLIASIAFIILGAASYGWCILFRTHLNYADNFDIGLAIFLLTLISGMVVSLLWCRNMLKSQSIALTILCYTLYIATISVAFGWVFSLAGLDMWWLPVMFLVTGGIFLFALMFAKILSWKSVMTMGKIIGGAALGMMVMLIIFIILAIIFGVTRSPGVALAGDTICSLIMIGMALVSFLYIIIDIWQISKMSEFSQEGLENKILAWFFGYRLLTDLVNVLFIILIFLMRYARRR